MIDQLSASNKDFNQFFDDLKEKPHQHRDSILKYASETTNLPFPLSSKMWKMNVSNFLDSLKTPKNEASIFWSSLEYQKINEGHYTISHKNTYSPWMTLTYNFYFFEKEWRLFTPKVISKMRQDIENSEFYYVLLLQASRTNKGGSLSVHVDTNSFIDVLGNKPFGYQLQPNKEKNEAKSYSVFNTLVFPTDTKRQLRLVISKSDKDPVKLGFALIKIKKKDFVNDSDEIIEKGKVIKDTSLLKEEGEVSMSGMFGYKQIILKTIFNKEVTFEIE